MGRLERERLEALYDLEILDTPPEAHLDRVCRLAAKLFQVPIALFSLVDRERLWFKSRYGLDVESAPREASFCDSATRNGETLIVSDAQQDPRFASGVLVRGPPYIRFYAGVPIRDTLGNALGTFCVIDRRPRQMRPDEIELLDDIAGVVQDHIRYLRAARRSGDSGTVEGYLRGVLGAIDRPLVVTDVRDRIRYHNKAARRYLGVADPIGKDFEEARSDRLQITERHPFRHDVLEGTVYVGAKEGSETARRTTARPSD